VQYTDEKAVTYIIILRISPLCKKIFVEVLVKGGKRRKISNSTIQRIPCLNSTWKVRILVNRQTVKRYMYIVTVA